MPFETLALGTMNFGRRTPEPEALRIIDLALERGVTFFDTANMYSDGDSERIIGRALGDGRRDRVKIATKVGVWRKEGLARARVIQALNESLERLRTDFVDVYYLHAPDPKTPLSETLDAVAELLEAGRIRQWGVSNFAAWQLVDIHHLCDARRLPRPAYSQVLYNLLVRQLEVEYFSCVKRFPIHTTVYNPLAGGLLARPDASVGAVPKGSRFEVNTVYQKRYWSEPMHELTRRFHRVASDAGLRLLDVAYAWLLRRPGVNSVLAGPASAAHFEAALGAVATPLPDAVAAALDQAYRDFVGTDASYAR